MDITRFLDEMKAAHPAGFSFATLMTKFGDTIGVPFFPNRAGAGWEPTKFFNFDDFEPHLGKPVATWHNIKTLCIVIEDESGDRLGIRQTPMRVPPFLFKPGALETLLDAIYHRSVGRTSDAGLKSALRSRSSAACTIPETWFAKALAETSDRRALWAASLIPTGRSLLQMLVHTPGHDELPVSEREAYEQRRLIRGHIERMLACKATLTGDEKFDRTAFFSVLSDMQATRDSLLAKVKP